MDLLLREKTRMIWFGLMNTTEKLKQLNKYVTAFV